MTICSVKFSQNLLPLLLLLVLLSLPSISAVRQWHSFSPPANKGTNAHGNPPERSSTGNNPSSARRRTLKDNDNDNIEEEISTATDVLPSSVSKEDKDVPSDLPSSAWGGPFGMRRRFYRGPSFDIVPLPRSQQPKQPQRATQNQSPPSSPPRKKERDLSGTRFDLRPPTPERLTQWFAPKDTTGPKRRRRKAVASVFNHDSVGMTNPVLHISLPHNNNNNNNPLIHLDGSSSTASVSLASSTSADLVAKDPLQWQDTWIPASTSTSTSATTANGVRVLQYKPQPSSDASRPESAEGAWFPATSQSDKKKWRQCRYRRRVGRGQECYERVRDAALEWQFQSSPSSTSTKQQNQGILPVNPSSNGSHDKDSSFSLSQQTSQHVQPIWAGPDVGGSRRLVTFTTTGFKRKWWPKLYTFNPVMVVYDVLDQRGPATTYTSTAYATLKGHLLRGEERVTVALRDDTGFVDVEILSYSQPAGSIKGKLVWPLIGNMQQRFFLNQMDHLEQVGLAPTPPVTPMSSMQEPTANAITKP